MSKRASMPAERRRLILEMLRQSGSVTVDQVQEQFGVSSMTARRDLGMLGDWGHLRRIHGGAVLTGSALGEQPFRTRVEQHVSAKQRQHWIRKSAQPRSPSASPAAPRTQCVTHRESNDTVTARCGRRGEDSRGHTPARGGGRAPYAVTLSEASWAGASSLNPLVRSFPIFSGMESLHDGCFDRQRSDSQIERRAGAA